MSNTIAEKTIEVLTKTASERTLVELRVGLGYTCARLDNGEIGLAWTGASHSKSCSHIMNAGKLAGSPATEVLSMITDPNPVSRSVALALANALIAGLPRPKYETKDTMELINITSDDHVVMVGFFGPLIPQIKKTGCKFEIVELDSDKPDVLSPEEGREALAKCSVAIITSTSVVTATVDELIASVKNSRAVVMLGPSTIMMPEIFAGTKVTHLGGAWAKTGSASNIERIVSEGGGTMLLSPNLEFATVML